MRIIDLGGLEAGDTEESQEVLETNHTVEREERGGGLER